MIIPLHHTHSHTHAQHTSFILSFTHSRIHTLSPPPNSPPHTLTHTHVPQAQKLAPEKDKQPPVPIVPIIGKQFEYDYSPEDFKNAVLRVRTYVRVCRTYSLLYLRYFLSADTNIGLHLKTD